MASRKRATVIVVLLMLFSLAAANCQQYSPSGYVTVEGSADLIRAARGVLTQWAAESDLLVANPKFTVLKRQPDSATLFVAFECQEQPLAPWLGYEGQVRLARTGGRWQAADEVTFGLDSAFLPRAVAAGTCCVCSVAFSPDGKQIASGSMDAQVRVWDVAGLVQRYAFAAGGERSCGVAFSPDGKLLAAAGEGPVTLHDATDGSQVGAFGNQDTVFGVAFSPDGRSLVTGGADTSVKVWDVGQRGLSLTLCQGQAIARAVAYAPDGKTVASGCRDGVVRIWHVPEGTVALEMSHPEAVLAIAYSPDSRLLATGGQDRAIHVWELGTGRKLYTLSRHTDWIMALAFSPDGDLIASGSRDGTVRLWRVANGEQVRVMGDENDSVRSLAFSPDGTLLAAGGDDGTLRLWRVK
jgi:WD40 repeat protein